MSAFIVSHMTYKHTSNFMASKQKTMIKRSETKKAKCTQVWSFILVLHLYRCVCIYVCMCACACIRSRCVYMHVHMYVCMLCMYVCACMCMCISMHLLVWVFYQNIYTSVRKSKEGYKFVCVCAYVRIDVGRSKYSCFVFATEGDSLWKCWWFIWARSELAIPSLIQEMHDKKDEERRRGWFTEGSFMIADMNFTENISVGIVVYFLYRQDWHYIHPFINSRILFY